MPVAGTHEGAAYGGIVLRFHGVPKSGDGIKLWSRHTGYAVIGLNYGSAKFVLPYSDVDNILSIRF
jgi:acyl dehydratase